MSKKTLSKKGLSKAVVVSVAIAVLLLAGCGKNTATSPANPVVAGSKIKVVATTPVIADFAKVIGGDKVDVYNVIKPGVDPHEFESTPADVVAIKNAKLIFKNGAGLENWFDSTLQSSKSEATVVDLSSGVDLRRSSDPADKTGDPHIWHSPQNAKIMVGNLVRSLVASDPDHRDTYESNQRAYSAQIDALDRSIRQSIEALSNKKIVTNHDALGYYIEEFGLEYVGSVIPSFDSQAELSVQQTAELVEKVKSQNVKAIFSESSLPPKTAETIAKESGAKIVEGEDSLYADSMGLPGSEGDTYLKMERHNTDVIVDNLK